MATPIETIVQASYVSAVTSQSAELDTSPSQSIPSSSSNANIDHNSQQSTIPSYRSFFRRAWDKVESIFVQKDASLPTYYSNYEREEDEDDDTMDEFIPSPYQQPFSRAVVFRPPVYKRRLSQHSQELISAGDYSPRSSSEWPTRQTYEDWQRDQGELYSEEDPKFYAEKDPKFKDLIAGWAMGENRPWFD